MSTELSVWGCLFVCFYTIIQKYREFKTQEIHSLEHKQRETAKEQTQASKPKPQSLL